MEFIYSEGMIGPNSGGFLPNSSSIEDIVRIGLNSLFHSSLAKLLAFCLFCFQNDKHTN